MIITGSLLFAAIIALVTVKAVSVKNSVSKFARIYFKQNLVQEIDLSHALEGDTSITVSSEHGDVVVTYHKDEIKISESTCPHQYCVHKGYITKTNDPIICAYNAISVVIEGTSISEVVI